MRPFFSLSDSLNNQRGHLFPWSPVALGIGIGFYFSLLQEPTPVIWAALVIGACLLLIVGAVSGPGLRPVVTGLILCLVGFLLAGVRAQTVSEIKLPFRYYGPIEGRIVEIDRSQSDAVRLTLDKVNLSKVRPGRTPARVRVSLHGPQEYFTPEPGLVIVVTGHLGPPEGPVEPGGYDFQRQAWFQRLGAVGYTRTPALVLSPHRESEAKLGLYRLRKRLSNAVQNALPGAAGAFAAAITTGDRSGMDRQVLDNLRASNLAHLLAISGLHMGLLTGFIFAATRTLLAAWPRIALYWPTKKIAAAVALHAGAVYLALSGGNVATERAFIMVAVMLGAVLVDRRAITLRAVAVAALIVLTLRPETLYGPGFQMSFAATTALVAVYGGLREIGTSLVRWPWLVRVIGGVALSSAVAGAATAPFAAAHFNQIPHYGLLANIVAVPLMGALIIPGAVLAGALAPLGLAWVGLALMELAILWILGVASTVSGWPSAISQVVTPGPAVVPLLTLGGLWVVIWQGRTRAAGLGLVLFALILWSQAERPDVLVSQSGGLIGVMTPKGRALSKERGESFAAMSWLENDGDPALQETAYGRMKTHPVDRLNWIEAHGLRILHATGKVAAALAVLQCADADLVIVNVATEFPRECNGFDARRLSQTGALAIARTDERTEITTVRDKSGHRLWSQ